MTRSRPATASTNDELSAATTATLVDRARTAFAELGYQATSVDAVAAAAGLSKGAVYYHFTDKRGLFEAAFRDAERDLVDRVERAAQAAPDPLAAVIAGCDAFLQAALNDELKRIVLVDGPAVLGWSRWRAIDREYGLGLLEQGLRACETADIRFIEPIELVAHVLSGAMNEAALVIAESDDQEEARDHVAGLLTAMLSSFTRPRP